MSKYLFFKLKTVSYRSYIYFAESLANALRKTGATVCFFDSEKEPLENMERLTKEHFDAIFDFNSALPRLQMDDDTFFLNHLDAPFYNFLLDHPLYHHDSLKQPIENMHVFCLDNKHVSYVKEYYPHIKSAHLFAMTGDEYQKDVKKDIPLLFCGSYTPSAEVLDALYKIPPFMQEYTKAAIDIMLADSHIQVHEALKMMLPNLDSIVEDHFPLHVQGCFIADTYIRALRREQVLKAVADASLPLTLCGNGWRKLKVKDDSNITYIDDIDFEDTFELMKRAQITLNIMPLFTDGSHDRVYSSMLNNSLCLTDESTLLKEQFSDRKDIVFYEILKPDSIPDIVSELIDSKERTETIAEAGHEAALSKHTWDARAELLNRII